MQQITEIALFGEFWASLTSQNYSQTALTYQAISYILFLLLDLTSFKYTVLFLSFFFSMVKREREREGADGEQDKTQFNFILLYSIYIPLWYNVDTILTR